MKVSLIILAGYIRLGYKKRVTYIYMYMQYILHLSYSTYCLGILSSDSEIVIDKSRSFTMP